MKTRRCPSPRGQRRAQSHRWRFRPAARLVHFPRPWLRPRDPSAHGAPASIAPDFRESVRELRALLSELRERLSPVEARLDALPAGDRGGFERAFLGALGEHVGPRIQAWMRGFDSVAARVGDDARDLHRAFARSQLHPLVLCAPFVWRSVAKPLGHAGDHEMVDMILRDPHEGPTLFAKWVNAVFLQNPPATAHRNRIRHLAERTAREIERVAPAGRACRVLDFGCGPAREIQDLLAGCDAVDRAEFTLVDFSGEALAFARDRLARSKAANGRGTAFRFEQCSANQLLRSNPGSGATHGTVSHDFIYCAGLFDYLSDRVCRRLLARFHAMLAPGGLLLATNVDDSQPFRQSMEYLLDWNLRYRGTADMKRLVPPDAAGDCVRVGTDPTGVNVYLEIRKPES